jgi:hypothetical protein
LREEIFNFYRDVYAEDIIATDNILGFKNKYFNNHIMTPHFLLNQDVSTAEVLEHKNLMGRNHYWLNSLVDTLDYEINNTIKNHVGIQYVFNTKKLLNLAIPGYRIEIIQNLSQMQRNKLSEITFLNSFNLSLDTQAKIGIVVRNSNAKVEYLLAYDNREVIGGYIIVHGQNISLLINGSLNVEYRHTGIFKQMLSSGVNHCLENEGKHATFYWTFNDKLMGRGDFILNSRIFSFK